MTMFNTFFRNRNQNDTQNGSETDTNGRNTAVSNLSASHSDGGPGSNDNGPGNSNSDLFQSRSKRSSFGKKRSSATNQLTMNLGHRLPSPIQEGSNESMSLSERGSLQSNGSNGSAGGSTRVSDGGPGSQMNSSTNGNAAAASSSFSNTVFNLLSGGGSQIQSGQSQIQSNQTSPYFGRNQNEQGFGNSESTNWNYSLGPQSNSGQNGTVTNSNSNYLLSNSANYGTNLNSNLNNINSLNNSYHPSYTNLTHDNGYVSQSLRLSPLQSSEFTKPSGVETAVTSAANSNVISSSDRGYHHLGSPNSMMARQTETPNDKFDRKTSEVSNAASGSVASSSSKKNKRKKEKKNLKNAKLSNATSISNASSDKQSTVTGSSKTHNGSELSSNTKLDKSDKFESLNSKTNSNTNYSNKNLKLTQWSLGNSSSAQSREDQLKSQTRPVQIGRLNMPSYLAGKENGAFKSRFAAAGTTRVSQCDVSDIGKTHLNNTSTTVVSDNNYGTSAAATVTSIKSDLGLSYSSPKSESDSESVHGAVSDSEVALNNGNVNSKPKKNRVSWFSNAFGFGANKSDSDDGNWNNSTSQGLPNSGDANTVTNHFTSSKVQPLSSYLLNQPRSPQLVSDGHSYTTGDGFNNSIGSANSNSYQGTDLPGITMDSQDIEAAKTYYNPDRFSLNLPTSQSVGSQDHVNLSKTQTSNGPMYPSTLGESDPRRGVNNSRSAGSARDHYRGSRGSRGRYNSGNHSHNHSDHHRSLRSDARRQDSPRSNRNIKDNHEVRRVALPPGFGKGYCQGQGYAVDDGRLVLEKSNRRGRDGNPNRTDSEGSRSNSLTRLRDDRYKYSKSGGYSQDYYKSAESKPGHPESSRKSNHTSRGPGTVNSRPDNDRSRNFSTRSSRYSSRNSSRSSRSSSDSDSYSRSPRRSSKHHCYDEDKHRYYYREKCDINRDTIPPRKKQGLCCDLFGKKSKDEKKNAEESESKTGKNSSSKTNTTRTKTSTSSCWKFCCYSPHDNALSEVPNPGCCCFWTIIIFLALLMAFYFCSPGGNSTNYTEFSGGYDTGSYTTEYKIVDGNPAGSIPLSSVPGLKKEPNVGWSRKGMRLSRGRYNGGGNWGSFLEIKKKFNKIQVQVKPNNNMVSNFKVESEEEHSTDNQAAANKALFSKSNSKKTAPVQKKKSNNANNQTVKKPQDNPIWVRHDGYYDIYYHPHSDTYSYSQYYDYNGYLSPKYSTKTPGKLLYPAGTTGKRSTDPKYSHYEPYLKEYDYNLNWYNYYLSYGTPGPEQDQTPYGYQEGQWVGKPGSLENEFYLDYGRLPTEKELEETEEVREGEIKKDIGKRKREVEKLNNSNSSGGNSNSNGGGKGSGWFSSWFRGSSSNKKLDSDRTKYVKIEKPIYDDDGKYLATETRYEKDDAYKYNRNTGSGKSIGTRIYESQWVWELLVVLIWFGIVFFVLWLVYFRTGEWAWQTWARGD